MYCHQYTVREERRLIEKETLGFTSDEANLNKTIIRQISRSQAEGIILTYEWLKSMPTVPIYYFGIFFQINDNEYLGGALIYCHEYSMNTHAWDKYDIKEKMILLARGVCVWWTPANTASFFIAKANRWILKNSAYRVITATVDPQAGERGIIYQASNWEYAGLMAGNIQKGSINKEHRRFAVIINGKKRGSRWIRRELGTMRKDIILTKYPDARFVEEFRKRRYFCFLGKEGGRIKERMRAIFVPYPQREELIEMHTAHCAYVYKITNKINGKVYIGQTIRDIRERFTEYRSYKTNEYLKRAFKKYGIDSFTFEVLAQPKSLIELNQLERDYIEKYNSTNRDKGYNLSKGGNQSSPSPETIIKMKLARKDIPQSAEWKEKRIAKAGSEEAKKYGRTKNKEERETISDKSKGENSFWFGKKRDAEMVKRMADNKRGKKMNPEAKSELMIRQAKRVEMTELNGSVTLFDSQTDASIATGISVNSISAYCKGKFKNKNGLLFKYV